MNFSAKSNYDVITASPGDVLMTWGLLDDDIYIIRYVRVGGIKE